MKTHPYPLIASSAAAIFLAALPSPAASPPFPVPDLQSPLSPEEFFESQAGTLEAVDRLLAQTPPPGGVMVPRPEIIIKSNGGSTPDILQPNVPGVPALPRAIAPPVGDMAISNIDSSPSTINLGTSVIVPRLVLRQAPAREVLAVLARYAGLNLVFTDTPAAGAEQAQAPAGEPTVSLDLENESVQEVFNSVLTVSGLTANRRGRIIYVGANLPTAARNLISRTLRLNQVKSFSAGTFLATQGAEFQRLVTQTEDIVDPLTNRIVGRREIPPNLEPIVADIPEGSVAPLLLSGLRVSADERLNSITLIGEPRQVQVATSLLTQLDARPRQVAVNVKVIDVNLANMQNFSSSFSFGFNDGFVIQDNGAALINFGNVNPPNRVQGSGTFAPPVVPLESTIVAPEGTTVELEPFFDVQLRAPFGNISRFNQGTQDFGSGQVPYSRPNFGTFNNPFQPGVTEFNPGGTTFLPLPDGTFLPIVEPATIEYTPPGLFEYPRRFLLTLQTEIQNGNAKVLTDPTLIVQEGQEATVKLVQKVVESVNTQVDPLSGVRTIVPVLADAGLTLAVNIDKIDDNGFVNLIVSPRVSAIGGTQEFDSGFGSVNTLNLLNTRELTSGLVRMRDGQTLILSGVIQETDRTTTSKVPILGDIPILGALFRSEDNRVDRTEVIILVTPQIVSDTPNATFGVNYAPGPEASEILRDQGFPVQVQP